MSDYRPIDCGIHSGYELAIMHRTPLRVRWSDADGGSHVESLLPEDLWTREGEEYLSARTLAGRALQIRLDRIHSAEPLD